MFPGCFALIMSPSLITARKSASHDLLKNFYLFIFWLCPVACGILVPGPGMESTLPAVEVRRLNHWTAREVPASANLLKSKITI